MKDMVSSYVLMSWVFFGFKELMGELQVSLSRFTNKKTSAELHRLRSAMIQAGQIIATSPNYTLPSNWRGLVPKTQPVQQLPTVNGKFQGPPPIHPEILMAGTQLGGGNSNMFWNFHPENWGRFSPILTCSCIFFRWVGEKPPTIMEVYGSDVFFDFGGDF